jgi:FkbM family methyltransferase
MDEMGVTRADLIRLQDLVLLQQARLHLLSDRVSRRQSAAAVQALFLDLQQVLQPEVTFEIGALFAQFSQEMSRRGVEAHAFEANPYSHDSFVRRLARRAPALKYHHMAISDADGEATFQIRRAASGRPKRKATNNSLMTRENPETSYETVTVPASRLDSFMAKNGLGGRPFSAWVDVEGALGKVTAGFGDALQSCLSLIVEVEEKRFWQDQMLVHDVMAYLDEQGMVPVARDFEYRHQYNLVYLRKDVFERTEVRMLLEQYLSTSHVAVAPPPVAVPSPEEVVGD